MSDIGPYETEAQARGPVHHIHAAAHAARRRGVMDDGNHRLLCDTLAAAGVECGAYDHEVIRWLSKFEPQMVAVVAGLVSRAYRAGALEAADAAQEGGMMTALTPRREGHVQAAREFLTAEDRGVAALRDHLDLPAAMEPRMVRWAALAAARGHIERLLAAIGELTGEQP